ncbi:unnamed protein product [Ilex paraguariensis]|uniref:RNase H type-1 domain-containing protein n=1 Tax=Ilex paraguariensis TaxID=185542 RepID=A0ABC8TW27_9AQUA
MPGSFFYGNCTSMEAEFRALLIGLELVKLHGFIGNQIEIESDSLVLVSTVKGGANCAWPYCGFLSKIKGLLGQANFQLRHVYRKANGVADSLANCAVLDGASSDFSVGRQLPLAIKMALLQDQKGLPVLRVTKLFDDKGYV